MKKLGKLSINPEKLINNEQLVNLRGGYLNCCYDLNNLLGCITLGQCGGTSGLDECQDVWPSSRTSFCG
ncbi:hypothetical protein [Draconibacterium sediminis]|uniref:hypothetical protein n=1 Tax=Draconibacterium sediminis TaxID=1544798 RepID=UPI0026EDEC72|nr:hypothetical protein [Draconibacterium sediminis]